MDASTSNNKSKHQRLSEVWCKPSQGIVPSEQAYALMKVLKRKFGAVET